MAHLVHPNRTEVGQPQAGSLGSDDHESIAFLLKQTRPWLLVIGVLMAIGAGLTLVRGFALGPILARLFSDRPGEVITATIAVRYLAFGAVCAQKSLSKSSGIAALGLIALYLILRTVALGVIPGQNS